MTVQERAREITKAIEKEIKEMQELEFSPITEYDVIEGHILKLLLEIDDYKTGMPL